MTFEFPKIFIYQKNTVHLLIFSTIKNKTKHSLLPSRTKTGGGQNLAHRLWFANP